ncbi:MAG: hypothetical protein COZ79_08885, partial [Hydrogenophilales bacterium CG_4_8_14_3_um_filter_62_83]
AALVIAALAPAAQADWVQQLAAASSERHFVQPAAAEVARAQALFLRLMQGERGEVLGKAWSDLGFALVNDTEQGLTWLQERPEARRGRGFFVFRPDGADALQMPHAFNDAMTGQIGIALFRRGRFGAAAWNTVPRDFVADGRRVDADMAHLDDSYAARKAAAILSDGSRTPAAALHRLATCIAAKTGARVLTYPEDVRELGATTNTVAAALRREGFVGFVHIEMSRPLRTDLAHSPAQQRKLLSCLEGEV